MAESPSQRENLTLEMSIRGIGGKGRPWYQIEYRVLSGPQVHAELGRADWADWEHSGSLVFAKRGCLLRQRLCQSLSAEPKQIADFNHLKFEEGPPSLEAQPW
jgi:hypothetical protein